MSKTKLTLSQILENYPDDFPVTIRRKGCGMKTVEFATKAELQKSASYNHTVDFYEERDNDKLRGPIVLYCEIL